MNKWTQTLLGAALAVTMTATAHAGPRLDNIMENKVLRVGTPGDYKPFAIKTDDGYEGHDIDVITAIAQELGVEIEYVDTSWPTLVSDIQADKFDIAVGGITRNVPRISQLAMLPGYAPFGKVALARKDEADKYQSVDDLNQPSVHVIKNPGGTNEEFVLEHLTEAEVSTHEQNAEIPGLIAEGKGDIMITETFEALHYSQADERLTALFVDNPLTPKNELGFMMPADDADYLRVMSFVWDILDKRDVLADAQEAWLK